MPALVASGGGALAAATYGVLTGLILPTLAGSRPVHRLVLWLLESRSHDRLPRLAIARSLLAEQAVLFLDEVAAAARPGVRPVPG